MTTGAPAPGAALRRAGLERGRMDGQVEVATYRLVTAVAAFAEPLLADMGLELVEIQ